MQTEDREEGGFDDLDYEEIKKEEYKEKTFTYECTAKSK